MKRGKIFALCLAAALSAAALTACGERTSGGTFTYEITVKNGDRATAPWWNVVAYDTLPAGVQLVGMSIWMEKSHCIS